MLSLTLTFTSDPPHMFCRLRHFGSVDIMKKKYIQQEMKVYDIEPQQILQSSTENFYLGGRPADDNEGMR